ncbi:alpha-1,6-glucosidase [Schaalia meyeri]|uniref:pullulanase-type alpha-1,6-glucosidase n=1 Tax=Schaalia meyeri TaxID=52773 RepID=UPI0006806A17|nr:pullulanase-type alpha-1,6-glucosidase [Schaalia meyeri]AKU65121.1 alpha-1,6-glucosidase [Schaalia meyeri]OFQ21636.1 alpha-1,6-glucosidase [Actinomyces sp. HMSC062G12]
MTHRYNRTLLRRALGVGAVLALMGGALPAAWAAPEAEASYQSAGARAAEAGENTADENLLVTIPGSHNKAMGCDADWAPGCAKAALTRDRTGVYSATFTLPAGDYEYKVAEGGSWDVSYGRGGVAGGANIAYSLKEQTDVTFYYNRVTHRVWNTVTDQMVTLPGSLQKALGCSDNWKPDCLAPLMEPVGDGTYTFQTAALPEGSYEVKVAIGGSWNENYGRDGVPGGANYQFATKANKLVTFTYDSSSHKLEIAASDAPVAGSGEQRAYWVSANVLAWPTSLLPQGVTRAQVLDGSANLTYELVTAPEGGAGLKDGAITGGTVVPLTIEGDLSGDVTMAHPNLSGYIALRADIDQAKAREALTGQIAVAQKSGGTINAFTGVQIAPVLDSIYAAKATQASFGVGWRDDGKPTFALWAPTAKNVTLLSWNTKTPGGADDEVSGDAVRTPAQRGDDGRWSVDNADGAIHEGAQYLWEVRVYVPSTGAVETNTVTDPYSVGLTVDSTRSVAVNMNDPSIAPSEWKNTAAPVLQDDAQRSIYELHVRDFSAKDESVPEEMRGTYMAFTQHQSGGMRHLSELAKAGMNTVHLLPTFDIATIPEKRSDQKVPDIPQDAGPASEAQQAAVAAVADQDAYNWGYDPFHWMAPEGSYATESHQNGGARVREFRSMVGGLHSIGMQVVLDQVYNHTPAAGQDAHSVLDRVVPGYYQRLNAAGAVETSTCCSNVATENAMSERLMIDSMIHWAKHYHVDGFRFDLMGHHPADGMKRAKEALKSLTLDKDGVDGSRLYIYGEGWNFGEVANNALFRQATQGQLDGTGIGAFNDRLRDAVHGGGPFDEDHRVFQGLGSGAFSDANGLDTRSADERRADYLHRVDLVKLGLAGNLKDYPLTTYDGRSILGAQLDYNGHGAGFASQPVENVNYVDAHDNETLFDLVTYKMPTNAPMDNRVRMSLLSQASVSLSQSPALWASGTEMLRSKSLDRDSYNSGDHFNAIDWTMRDNGFGRGLPMKSKNGAAWDHMRPLLENPDLKPSPEQIDASSKIAMDFLRVRSSSRLFTLGSADLVRSKVSFPNSGSAAVDGTIMMLINDEADSRDDIDRELDGALVVFNATGEAIKQRVDGLAGRVFKLHEAQAGGADEVVKGASFDGKTGTVTVPARTVAVFTQAVGARVNPAPDPSEGKWIQSSDGRWWLRYPDGSYPFNERIKINGITYSFDSEGWMKTGWEYDAGQWRYYKASGAMATGWTLVGGSWFYLDPASGVMATGWLRDGANWYYLTGSGAMATGWTFVGGSWYYLSDSGVMATGWLPYGSSWFYLDPASGAMTTGWLRDGANWYYLTGSGAMATGWTFVGGSWYYLSDSGVMATGWLPYGSSWYYLDPASGAMVTGRVVVDGTTYTFDSSGRWIA